MQYQGYRPDDYQTPPPVRAAAPRRKRRRLRWGRVLALALIAALIIGAVVLLSSDLYAGFMDYRKSQHVFLPNTYVDGVALSGMTYDEAWNAVTARVEEWRKSWSLKLNYAGFTYTTLTYDTLGVSADYGEINALLNAAWAYGHNGFSRYQEDVALLAASPYQGYTSRSESSEEQLSYILSIIANDVYRAPTDARILLFDPNKSEPFTFQTEVKGRQLDVQATLETINRMASTGEAGELNVITTETTPGVTRAALEKSVALISTATTAIDKSSTAARNDNIRLAFSLINGTVLNNGDKFSFNRITKKRSVSNGYKTALGYTSGELAEVVGGGVCQCSSTVYLAAVCAGMTVTSRTPHSMPVSYISMGQDATVNDMRGHEIDLAFTNNTGAPVYITAKVEKNSTGRLQCVVRIYGQSMGEDVFYRLTSTETTTIPAPLEDIIRKDTQAKYVTYTTEKYKLSSAREGHVVETRLQRVENGAVTQETLISTDTYKEKAAIYYVGVTER